MASQKVSVTNEVWMKRRITELESQVTDYKKRLEGLRKAKNTTVVKREREVVQVGGPNLGKRVERTNEEKIAELERQLEESENRRKQERDDLIIKHDKELQDVKNDESQKNCGHDEELKRLRRQIDELMGERAALGLENRDLRDRVDSLMQDLSIKEAQWCEAEEKLNRKLKTQWGEKYAQWMQETEKRITELQESNTLLRGYLKNRNPDGRDSTREDES